MWPPQRWIEITFNSNVSYDYQLSVNKTGISRSEVGLSRPVRSPWLYLVSDKTSRDVIKWLYTIIEVFYGYVLFFETRVLIFISYTVVYLYYCNIHLQRCMYYFIDQKRLACFEFCITYEDTENCQRI